MAEEYDSLLPIANVGRIMKKILPPSAKVSKEAKETMQECASEFVSFVTGEAADKCHKENRKTVNGDDICWALSSLGFDNYAGAIVRYLHKYREFERERAAAAAEASNQINKATTTTTTTTTSQQDCTDHKAASSSSEDDQHDQLEFFSVLQKGVTSSSKSSSNPEPNYQ
ncbi:nuclear transcription factor Y subunit B-4-like [Diospyros lotus]|uniref:nuclear transcription factor Y subunit B-4-like n=1 Tax=Diospyros lotus TaxID=55363 RepID=UPI00225A7537|nr:nuclear transcription factor Y subunit B-4-like [Diospyros lotus]